MSQQSEQEEKITAVVGLGNPGKQYETTRHNAGFRVVDLLARSFSFSLQERKFQAAWGSGMIEGQKILLFKPLTFMNRSGEAVGEMLRYFGVPASQMLVVHDDLDLSCGRIRLVRRGGAGGHRGIQSILQHIGNQDFPRLKLGIGRPMHREPVEAYVLKSPYPEEVEGFDAMIGNAVDAVRAVLSSGLSVAMNRFNKRESQSAGPCELP
jgi:PTH1 family peptidyl-tRNA hydrolase